MKLNKRFAWLLCAASLLVSAVCGCRAPVRTEQPAPTPLNVYRMGAGHTMGVRRVVVLPITSERPNWEEEAGAVALENAYKAELGKIKMFEPIFVSREQLRLWTGRESWAHYETLPATLFPKLEETFGCDGVMFAHLRPFHGFKPIVVGWHMVLVDLRSKQILWSADEVFDGGEPAVARSAQDHFRNHGSGGRALEDPSTVLISPARFSEYTLCTLFSTFCQKSSE